MKTFKFVDSICPCCNSLIKVGIAISAEVTVEKLSTDDNTNLDDWRSGLTDGQIAAIENAESIGAIEAFRQAVDESKSLDTPRDIRKFFLTFWRTARPKAIPRISLSIITRSIGGRIDIWAAQGVSAVVADGRMRQFIPIELLTGAPITKISRANKTVARMDVDENLLKEWIDSKKGYISRGCMAASVAKAASIG